MPFWKGEYKIIGTFDQPLAPLTHGLIKTFLAKGIGPLKHFKRKFTHT